MKPIKVVKDFTLGDKEYFIGDEINANEIGLINVIKLNEKGYIEPLTRKEINEIKNKEE